MKAFFKAFFNALLYPLLYVAVQLVITVVVTVVAGVAYAFQNALLLLPTDEMAEELTVYLASYAITHMQYILIISAALTFVIILAVFRVRKRSFASAMILAPVRCRDTAALVVAGVSLNLSCVLLVGLMPQQYINDYENSSIVAMLNSGDMAANILCLLIAVPFIEEVIFRGLTFNRLRSGMGLAAAVVLQTVIFAVVHFNFIQTFYVLISGCVLAMAYLWSRSLLGSMLLHAAYNCTGLVLSRIETGSTLDTTVTILVFLSPAVLAFALYMLYRSYNRAGAGSLPTAGA